MNCKECAKEYDIRYCEPVATQMRDRCLCFTCNFWYGFVLKKDHCKTVRIDGLHYYIGFEGSSDPGYYGREFVIVFNDGRKVITHNLSHNGTIPEHFRDRLPDNGRFK